VVCCAVLAFRGTESDSEGLFLYCGAGIRPAVEDIRAAFTSETGIPVTVTYAGSGCLLSMLTFARSGDLYMPGERYYMDQAEADGHVSESSTVAHFVAVVMVQKGNPKGIRSMSDLARPDVRVGVGETDTVACGLVAKRILEKADVWEAVKANIDAQGAYTGTAVELSNALVLNALDAAINWDAMAYLVRDRVDIITIPRERNIDVEIPLGVLSWSTRMSDARRFVEFVRSDRGQQFFEAHGYHASLDRYALPYYGDLVLE
jgi:molybdate transport system substrate-binding protein